MWHVSQRFILNPAGRAETAAAEDSDQNGASNEEKASRTRRLPKALKAHTEPRGKLTVTVRMRVAFSKQERF
jgi:hypothetical protein